MLRRVVSAAILVALLGLERFAYYGMRSILLRHLLETQHVDRTQALLTYRIFSWAMMLTPVLGGLVCVALPPRFGVLLGALGATLAYALLAIAPPAFVIGALGVLAIALGLFRPAVIVAAGETFGLDATRRTTTFALLYASINAGALVAPFAAGAARTALGGAAAFGGSAAVMVVVAVLAAAAAAIPTLLPVDDEPAARPDADRFAMPALLASLGLLFAALPTHAVSTLAGNWQYSSDDFTRSLSWTNPLVVIGVCALLAAGVMAAGFARIRIFIAIPIALGLLLTALSAAPAILLPPSTVPAVVSAIAGGVGEALIAVFLLSRLSAGVHPRAQTFVVAVYLIGTSGIAAGADAIPSGVASTVSLAVLSAICVVVAIAVGALYRPLANAFNDEKNAVTPDVAPAL